MLYLIEGELELILGAETLHLAPGDAVYFDAVQKHAYRSLVSGPCTAVVVTTGSSM